MPEIAQGVSFDKIAREWRCKWDNVNKESLVKAQAELDAVLASMKATPGVLSVQRVVCGGCHDFKVITQLSAEDFGKWEASKFQPEEDFLAKLKAIEGISAVETQTYTLMTL